MDIRSQLDIPTMEDLILYTAVALDEESKERLVDRFAPKHEKVYADHITLVYQADAFPQELGKEVTVDVTGYIRDSKAEAVSVELPEDISSNKSRPHITLSTAEGTTPKYSNQLLEGETFPIEDLQLSGQVVAHMKLFGDVIEVPELPPTDKVVLPTRPQTDTVIALYLLYTYGKKIFPQVASADIDVASTDEEKKDTLTLLNDGVLPLDVGGGVFDHHEHGDTAAGLVAHFLYLKNDPSVQKMLKIARRDDQEGKGIVSSDPLDRAFGLPGLIMALNKVFADDPAEVVRRVIPVLEGHHLEEVKREIGTPNEYKRKKEAGEVVQKQFTHNGGQMKLIGLHSDNASMPGWLRSKKGKQAHVVIQRQKSGHTNILTRPDKQIDLSLVAALIRQAEVYESGQERELDTEYAMQFGQIDEVPYWYHDDATNSLLNGGVMPKDTQPTQLSFEKIVQLTKSGLEKVD